MRTQGLGLPWLGGEWRCKGGGGGGTRTRSARGTEAIWADASVAASSI